MQVLAFVCLLSLLVALISAQSVNERRDVDGLADARPEDYEGFLRSFRSSSSANGKPTFIRFGKRAQPSFIRFGKRAQPSFIRFGRSSSNSIDY